MNLQPLAPAIRDAAGAYAQAMQRLWGPNIQALAFYGAAAAGTFDPARQTARNVIVCQDADLEVLKKLSRDGARWGKKRIAAPLVMTPQFIEQSRDSFPLELLDIQQQHVRIFGDDFFTTLAFQTEHIRLQSERELKTVILAMRQALLTSEGRTDVLAAIDSEVAERLVRTIRGLLWLHDERTPRPALEVVFAVEQATGTQLGGLKKALAPQQKHDWEDFKALHGDVHALKKIAETW